MKRISTVLGVALGLGLGGCANIEYSTFRLPDISLVRLPSMSAPVVVEPQKPVAAEDMVDAEGRCASSPLASAAAGPEAPGADPVTVPNNPALVSGGVALGMTECDVVKRQGPPENITLGTNEKSERTLVLSYTKTVRPGIYNFVAGRLVSIDRAPEPPAPAKPAKPTKSAKPKPKPKPAPS
jgi:hypothetical protein